MTNSLLNEKYRPTDLSNYVGNEDLKSTIKSQLDKNDIQNMLFYGPAGSGKTTLAKLIIHNLDCDSLYINASDERGIETIRDKVSSFASVMSFKPIKVIILDEADFLTIQAQASLRNIIETYSRTTRFIMTCNYVERIIDPLQSRCQTFKIIPPSKKEIAIHLSNILESENITHTNDDIKNIVLNNYPDLRRMINTIQSNTIDNKLNLPDNLLVTSSYMESVLDELCKPKPNLKSIRQTIQNSGVNDFEEMFRFLYDNASKYLPNKEGTVALLINEHAYKANFRIDKEINLIALIQQLINNK